MSSAGLEINKASRRSLENFIRALRTVNTRGYRGGGKEFEFEFAKK